MRTKKNTAAARGPRKVVHCVEGSTEIETWRNAAGLICSPELAAYRVINAVDGESGLGEVLDVPALMEHLRNQAEMANAGNLMDAEAMLINQATALQSLFVRLVERGMGQATMPTLEGFMRLAMRAQSQCRTTLETLAAIKNPPIVYARQANVTTGPQQINNGQESHRARENTIEQTQLLERRADERLDFGEAAAAGGVDQTMATVGTVNRPTNSGRKTGQR